MQNIQLGSQEKVYLEVYSDGVSTQADSLPTLSIYDADNDASPISGFNSIQVIDEPDSGQYAFLITQLLTSVVRMLELRWHYVINGLPVTQTEFYQVQPVYSTVNEIIDFLGFGTTQSEINYHSISEIKIASGTVTINLI